MPSLPQGPGIRLVATLFAGAACLHANAASVSNTPAPAHTPNARPLLDAAPIGPSFQWSPLTLEAAQPKPKHWTASIPSMPAPTLVFDLDANRQFNQIKLSQSPGLVFLMKFMHQNNTIVAEDATFFVGPIPGTVLTRDQLADVLGNPAGNPALDTEAPLAPAAIPTAVPAPAAFIVGLPALAAMSLRRRRG